MKTSNFILFSDCIPVKGFNRSVICDTKNNRYFFIPNSLYSILEKYNGKTVDIIKKDFDHQYNEIIDEYFVFLVENRLVFFNPTPELFPEISTQWHSPSKITNMIIDYDGIMHDFNGLMPQLEALKCSYIQLRFFKQVELDFLKALVQRLNDESSRVVSIDFIIPYYEDLKIEELNSFLSRNMRIHSVIIYSAPYYKSFKPVNGNMGYIMQTERNIVNEKHCGIISPEYFYSNINLFSESQRHNTCLNRKVSIDKEGYIRNCPSMPQQFGNIKDVTLEEAIGHPDFKKYWNISKDQVEICRDCEFRHVCTDCRAYTERNSFDGEIDLSRPLKCGYDPYTNEWAEWSANPLKQKAIEYYGMQELVNNHA